MLPFPVSLQYLVFIQLPSNRERLEIRGHEVNFKRILQRISCDLTFVKRSWLTCNSIGQSRGGSLSEAQREEVRYWCHHMLPWKEENVFFLWQHLLWYFCLCEFFFSFFFNLADPDGRKPLLYVLLGASWLADSSGVYLWSLFLLSLGTGRCQPVWRSGPWSVPGPAASERAPWRTEVGLISMHAQKCPCSSRAHEPPHNSTCEPPDSGPCRSDRGSGRSTNAWRRAPSLQCRRPRAASDLPGGVRKVWGGDTGEMC